MKKLIPAFIAVFALACSLTNSLTTAEPSATATPHPTGTNAAPLCIVTATHLNFRSAPGMNAPVIAVLDYGEAVTIRPFPTAGNWIPVTAAGRDGWINQNYCKKETR